MAKSLFPGNPSLGTWPSVDALTDPVKHICASVLSYQMTPLTRKKMKERQWTDIHQRLPFPYRRLLLSPVLKGKWFVLSSDHHDRPHSAMFSVKGC